MRTRRISIATILIFFLVTCWTAAMAASDSVSPDKAVVIDGRYVHLVGQIGHNVTNWGLLGSTPGVNVPYSDSPSAQWPIWSGNEYLWGAGLWVGGVVLGEELVTTGSFSSEFRPTSAPGDTIFPTFHGAPGGNRFPWTDPDDDGDGAEDEELLNGLDDDGDGLVDEDFAAIGDQHFFCAYNDYEPEIQDIYPDHYPLRVEVVQQSIQWSNPLAEDFIGYDFTITNMGVVAIEDVYLGMFSDFDIGPRGFPSGAADDYAGFVATMAPAADGTMVPVQVAYMYDGADQQRLPGYVGWVLCGHTTDPAGVAAPVEPGVVGFQRFSGNASYEQGGDPTNDAERYELLSLEDRDPDVLPGRQSDYRVLMSSGPFTSLEPGQSISYQLALVIGAGLDEMIANAAEAVATYQGRSYYRDGDPANGDEFTVHWLSGDIPVAAETGRIMAQMVPGGVELRIETNLSAGPGLSLVRRSSDAPGTPADRRWEAAEWAETGFSGNNRLYRVLDSDQGGWPRHYELVYEAGGGSIALDRTELDTPPLAAVALSASPNPFNPRVNIRFTLPEAGHLQLKVFDLHGRLVSTLVDEVRAEGSDTITWQGDDDSGRAMASGVYQVLMLTEGQQLEERITLVR